MTEELHVRGLWHKKVNTYGFVLVQVIGISVCGASGGKWQKNEAGGMSQARV